MSSNDLLSFENDSPPPAQHAAAAASTAHPPPVSVPYAQPSQAPPQQEHKIKWRCTMRADTFYVPRPGTLFVESGWRSLRFQPLVGGKNACTIIPLKDVVALEASGSTQTATPAAAAAAASGNNIAPSMSEAAGTYISGWLKSWRGSKDTAAQPQHAPPPLAKKDSNSAPSRTSSSADFISPTSGLHADAPTDNTSGLKITMKNKTSYQFNTFLGKARAGQAFAVVEYLWNQALSFRLASAQSEFELLQHFSQPGIFDTELHSSEFAEGDEAGQSKAALVQSISNQRSFHALFRLPPSEKLVGRFAAWLSSSAVSLRGHIFVSENFMAFFTRDSGMEVAVLTPLAEVFSVAHSVNPELESGGLKFRLDMVPYDDSGSAKRIEKEKSGKRRTRFFELRGRDATTCLELLMERWHALDLNVSVQERPDAATLSLATIRPGVADDLVSIEFSDSESRLSPPKVALITRENIDVVEPALVPTTGVVWPTEMLSSKAQFSEWFRTTYTMLCDPSQKIEEVSGAESESVPMTKSRSDSTGSADGGAAPSESSQPTDDLSEEQLSSEPAEEVALKGPAKTAFMLDRWRKYRQRYGRGLSMVRYPGALGPLIQSGIPECLRPELWPIFCGAYGYFLSHKPNYYRDLLQSHLHEPSLCVDEIEKDLCRSFPEHPYYSGVTRVSARGGADDRVGPGIDPLRRVLTAYSWRNSKDVGYCQSMNIVTAFFLLYVQEEAAFWLVSILCESLVPEYYHRSLVGSIVDYRILSDVMIPKFFPELSKVMDVMGKEFADTMLSLAVQPWLLCFFIGYVPHEVALRVLDLVFYYDRDMLLCAAIAGLLLRKDQLLAAYSADQLMTICKTPLAMSETTADDFAKIMVETYAQLPRSQVAQLRNREKRRAIDNIESNNLKRKVRELSSKTRFKPAEAEQLHAIFESAHKLEVSNYIEYEQFEGVFTKLFPARWREIGGLSDSLFSHMDAQHRGRLDFKDFLVGMDFMKGNFEERLHFCVQRVSKNESMTRVQLTKAVDAFVSLCGFYNGLSSPEELQDAQTKITMFVTIVFGKIALRSLEMGVAVNVDNFDDAPPIPYTLFKELAVDVPLLAETFHINPQAGSTFLN